jgi:translation initiation factor 1
MRLFEGTQFDRPPHCEHCGKLEAECDCPPAAVVEVAPEKQTLKLSIENRKKGKQVTVVRGFQLSESALTAMVTTLKTACGAGGTIHEGNIEIQGDQADRLRAKLSSLGYRVKG